MSDCEHDEVSFGRCRSCRAKVVVLTAGYEIDDDHKWISLDPVTGKMSKPLSSRDKSLHRAIAKSRA